jgi:RNA polymerase sigma-70 factor, ECF subfamily
MVFKSINIRRKTGNDDIAVFEMLFRKYYSDLVNYSARFTGDFDASEEIVQDFFYNFWKNRKTINIRLSVKAYLYRSIKNNTLNFLDALNVRRKYADRVLNMSKDQSGYEDKEMEFSELNELVKNTLDELPERCRIIFRMSRFDGLKYEEIAKELSVSVKTVEANIGKALKLLRVRLDKYTRSGVH